MKIGILTYHRSHNNGALLQAIALRAYLISNGHEVYFIDYWPKYHDSLYKLIDTEMIKRISPLSGIKYIIRTLPLLCKKKIRKKNFESFINKFIKPFSLPYTSDTHFDVVIYGSDQIWRKQDGLNKKFNEVYFGKNIISTPYHISYAASMGMIHWNEKDKLLLKDNLSRFSALGVREKDLQEHLTSLSLNNVTQNIDPTFLPNISFWEESFKLEPIIKEPYILIFDLLGNCFNYKNIKKYASKNDLKVVVLDGFVKSMFTHAGQFDTDGPETFLSLIKHSSLVLTSSFHALAFSIIFRKQFYVSFSHNASRAQSLLELINEGKRMLSVNENIPENDSPINYEIITNKLDQFVTTSKEFLVSALTSLDKIPTEQEVSK